MITAMITNKFILCPPLFQKTWFKCYLLGFQQDITIFKLAQ